MSIKKHNVVDIHAQQDSHKDLKISYVLKIGQTIVSTLIFCML